MRFIVHIGRPKSGTTALQHYLFHNRRGLSEQGFSYLVDPGRVNLNRSLSAINHVRLKALTSAEADERVGQLRTTIFAQARETGANIVSAETLSNVRPAVLQEVLKGSDYTVVAYVRNELDFIASSYAHWIAWNWLDVPVDTYLTPHRLKISGNLYFLDEFAGVFGSGFRPRYYATGKTDTVTDFCDEILGVERDAFSAPRTDSAGGSLSSEMLLFKRWLVRQGYRPKEKQKTFHALIALGSEHPGRYRLPMGVAERALAALEPQRRTWIAKYFDDALDLTYETYEFATDEGPHPDYEALLKRFEEHIEKPTR